VNFVLDTNAVSETVKPRPNPEFITWRNTQDPASLFITTITLAEVWQGFYSLAPQHPDYDRVKLFSRELAREYRVLNFDARAAAVWGEMTAGRAGPFPARDSFIAAIVRSRGYRVVTRDAGPFERMGCNVINPWK
jgi:predicted nucleic acid-binding protein